MVCSACGGFAPYDAASSSALPCTCSTTFQEEDDSSSSASSHEEEEEEEEEANVYSYMGVKELKALLKTRKLPVSGNKPELVKRLQDQDAGVVVPKKRRPKKAEDG